jgi:hypothetical protein
MATFSGWLGGYVMGGDLEKAAHGNLEGAGQLGGGAGLVVA